MFTETIDVRPLQRRDVNERAVRDLNSLLAKQHTGAQEVDEARLLDKMRSSRIVVAWHDDRIVGMGVLIKTECLTHSFAAIHHLVIHEGYDVLVLGMRIVKTLLTEDTDGMAFFEAGVWLQEPDLAKILEGVGFKEKPGSRYRLRIATPKK